MKVNEVTLSAADLGAVLGGITARRVRQLAEEGTLPPPVSRGAYGLADSVCAYLAALETRGDSDELRVERIRLTRAQAIKLELENDRAAGTEAAVDTQEAAVNAVAMLFLLRIRPLATWLHELMRDRRDDCVAASTDVAHAVNDWILSSRAEAEDEVARILVEARRRQLIIRNFYDLLPLIGGPFADIFEGEEPCEETVGEEAAS